jgi:hypothetical protein
MDRQGRDTASGAEEGEDDAEAGERGAAGRRGAGRDGAGLVRQGSGTVLTMREEEKLTLLRWQLWDLLRYILFDRVSPPANEWEEDEEMTDVIRKD